jgi:hypothetical protein
MAELFKTTWRSFPDRTLGYQISKADLERLTDAFYRRDRSEYASLQRQAGAGESGWFLEQADLRALAEYGRAVDDLLGDWQAAREAFQQEMKSRDDDPAFQDTLDQLDALLQQAEAMAAPDSAAAVHRILIAMLRSERAYFHQLVDDVAGKVIEQFAADCHAEAIVFRAEFNRLLRRLS